MTLRPALKITLIYTVFGLIWIFLSDRFLYLFLDFKDERSQMIFQNFKGTFYVLLTGYLLYVLMKKFYKKSETRLTELEAREEELYSLQQLTKTSNWKYDVQSTNIFWSPVATELFEITHAEVKENRYLLSENLNFLQDREFFLQAIKTAEAEWSTFDFEQMILTFRGNEKWIRIVGKPIVKNGECVKIVGSVQDITSLKKYEANILQLLERYDILSKATSDTIWDLDIESDYIIYNGGMMNVFGYAAQDIGRSSAWKEDKIHKTDIGHQNSLYKEVLACCGETMQSTYRFRCADGTYKYITDRVHITYDENKKPCRLIGTMQDITAQMELETRIERAVINMQEQERQQFGMELHDNVNQILAASLLFIGFIKDARSSNQDTSVMFEKTEQYIKDAIDEVRRLSHELAPVSFKEISITQVFHSLLDTLPSSKLFNIKIDVDAQLNDMLPLDLKMNLYRILQEQMNNIVKYAQAKKVLIELKLQEGIIKMHIQDDGKGFDVNKKSNGIGLENMRRRAKLFSGSFKLITHPGKGCEILVEVPLRAG